LLKNVSQQSDGVHNARQLCGQIALICESFKKSVDDANTIADNLRLRVKTWSICPAGNASGLHC
jgi:hypothetical protein